MNSYITVPLNKSLVKILDADGNTGTYTVQASMGLIIKDPTYLTEDKEGWRIYNPKPVYDESDPPVVLYSKGWYEVVEELDYTDPEHPEGKSYVPKRFKWQKVTESSGGGGVTLITDSTVIPEYVGEIGVYVGAKDVAHGLYTNTLYVGVEKDAVYSWGNPHTLDNLKVIDVNTTTKKLTDEQFALLDEKNNGVCILWDGYYAFYSDVHYDADDQPDGLEFTGIYPGTVTSEDDGAGLYPYIVIIHSDKTVEFIEGAGTAWVPWPEYDDDEAESDPDYISPDTDRVLTATETGDCEWKDNVIIKRDELPVAADTDLGVLMQWIGDDDDTIGMVKDHIYVCKEVEDPEDPSVKIRGWHDILEYNEDTLVGDIQAYAGDEDKIPDNWHICNGDELLISAYPELYSAIGDRYGLATQEGYFKLPDLTDRFIEGTGENLGDYKDAGLPNIKGELGSPLANGATGSYLGITGQTGAFTGRVQSGNDAYTTGNNANGYVVPILDASRMPDHIYKDDVHTVQPPALKLVYIIRTRPGLINTVTEDILIGDIRAFGTDTVPDNWLKCDGTQYKIVDYPDLFNVIEHKYDLSTDTDTTKFRVPNLVDKFIEGATTSGATVDAGLPNIKAGSPLVAYSTHWNSSDVTNYQNSFSGAFKGSTATGEGGASYSGGQLSSDLRFDASKGQYNPGSSTPVAQADSIFGKSSTVQPPALKLVYAIRARKAAVNAYSDTVEVTRSFTTTAGSATINWTYSQIGREAMLNASTMQHSSIPTNTKLVSLDTLRANGVKYPAVWDTNTNEHIFLNAFSTNAGSTAQMYICKQPGNDNHNWILYGGAVTLNNAMNWTIHWIADKSADTGHFIEIDRTPTDGDTLVYSSATNTWKPSKGWSSWLNGRNDRCKFKYKVDGDIVEVVGYALIDVGTYNALVDLVESSLPLPKVTVVSAATDYGTEKERFGTGLQYPSGRPYGSREGGNQYFIRADNGAGLANGGWFEFRYVINK